MPKYLIFQFICLGNNSKLNNYLNNSSKKYLNTSYTSLKMTTLNNEAELSKIVLMGQKVPIQGLEPWYPAWKASMLTTYIISEQLCANNDKLLRFFKQYFLIKVENILS